MASLSAIMTKRGQAKKRIDVATEKLVEIFGIDVPPSPGNVAQSELRHALELDRLATILESILESTDPGSLDVDDDDDDAETDGADGSTEDGEAKDESVSDDASTDGSDDPATSGTETVVPAKPPAKPATAQAPKKAAASKAPATRSRKAKAARAKKRRG